MHELFRRGDINWFLNPSQRKMMDWLDAEPREVSTICISRQFGKTTCMLLYAFAYCLRHPRHNVLFVAPWRAQLEAYLMPRLNMIFQFVPDDILPHKRGMSWHFRNGSIFRCEGLTMGGGTRLRGDAAHMVIIDECRDIPQLKDAIDSAISPMFATTNGRLILISTPPESSAHAFTSTYVADGLKNGSYYSATYKDNPLLSTKRLRYLFNIQYPGGEDNPTFRREYMADWSISDPEKLVVREWDQAANDKWFETYPGPPSTSTRIYTGLDYAFADPCGILCGYLDAMHGCLVITDEWFQRGMNTDEVGAKVQEMENRVRDRLPNPAEPRRIMDIDPSLMSDLYNRFHLRFEPCHKLPSILTMLNRLRVAFLEGRVRVHPRCAQLRFQLSSGVFTARAGSTTYQRTEKSGHLDLLDALKYINLNCNWNEIMTPQQDPAAGQGQVLVGGFAVPKTFRHGMLRRPV